MSKRSSFPVSSTFYLALSSYTAKETRDIGREKTLVGPEELHVPSWCSNSRTCPTSSPSPQCAGPPKHPTGSGSSPFSAAARPRPPAAPPPGACSAARPRRRPRRGRSVRWNPRAPAPVGGSKNVSKSDGSFAFAPREGQTPPQISASDQLSGTGRIPSDEKSAPLRCFCRAATASKHTCGAFLVSFYTWLTLKI